MQRLTTTPSFSKVVRGSTTKTPTVISSDADYLRSNAANAVTVKIQRVHKWHS